LVGFVPVLVFLLLLQVIGQADTPLTLFAFPLGLVSLSWVPARVAAVEVEP
jgi:hypothetical protein